MKIAAISDIHGDLNLTIPECDLLLIAGDICPSIQNKYSSKHMSQAVWLTDKFEPWLLAQPAKQTVAVWGNHDWIGEKPFITPKLPWTLLHDSGTQIGGLNIYGSPWQIEFLNWAFNLTEPGLEKKWALIPDNTDILVLHGPPYGYGDLAPPYPPHTAPEHVGSPSLLRRIREIKPKLVVFGHIHEGRGIYEILHEDGNKTILANVTVLNAHYRMSYEPMIFDID